MDEFNTANLIIEPGLLDLGKEFILNGHTITVEDGKLTVKK